jgi:hypothetical protein
MKRYIFPLILLLIPIFSFAQVSTTNGGYFTAKGHIHALIVFVGFDSEVRIKGEDIPFNHQEYANWDIKNGQELPALVDPDNGEMEIIHEKVSDLGNGGEFNLTEYYSDMSFGKFLFTGETLKDPKTGKPIRIDINPKEGKSIPQFNALVLKEIDRRLPNFDWKRFDKRKNSPNYRFDSSITKPDGKPDFVIFVYRNSPGFKRYALPPSTLGWGGAVASSFLSSSMRVQDSTIRFDESGFTNSSNGTRSPKLFMTAFLHEIGHKLYRAPHYNAANGSFGGYFYIPQAAYGMMCSENQMNMVANGWEKWMIGWTEILKKGEKNHQSIDEIKAGEFRFILRDFATTGDVIRLPIPNVKNQFLWIENHQNISRWEKGTYSGRVLSQQGEEIPLPDTGCYAYVERISPKRSKLPSYGDKYQTNALYLLNAQGNWDYKRSEECLKNWHNFFNNPVYTFERIEENPLTGHNGFMKFIDDFPLHHKKGKQGDNTIKHQYSSHGGSLESVFFLKEKEDNQEVMTYAGYGGVNEEAKYNLNRRSPFFQDKDKLSLSGNQPIVGLREIDWKTKSIKPIKLNGVEVQFKELSDGRFEVIVRYDQFKVTKKKSLWKGNILVSPNYLDSNAASIILAPKTKVVVKNSLTNNTFNKQENGTFIQSSSLTIQKGAGFELQNKSQLIIDRGCTLTVEENAKLKLGPKTKLIINPGGILNIHPKAIIQMHPSAVMDLPKGE